MLHAGALDTGEKISAEFCRDAAIEFIAEKHGDLLGLHGMNGSADGGLI